MWEEINIREGICKLFIFCLLLLVGCAGITTVGSENNKATILYFEGGNGQIFPYSDNKLINRSIRYFQFQGIIVTYMTVDLPQNRYKSIAKRYSNDHFRKIQIKVNKLIKNGHSNIWLMGISNGGHSILYAGANQIQGVEGLILVNLAATGVRWGELKKVQLPILAVTHEEDGGPLKDLSSDDDFKKQFSSSTRPKLVVFSGGRTGTSREATQNSQKYQHGLRGLEQKFAQTVIDFIYSNSQL